MRSVVDAVMIASSAIGSGSAIWLFLGAAAVCLRRRRAAGVWQMALAVLVVSIVGNGVIKPMAHRPRPEPTAASMALLPDRPASWSFPSGHAASAFAGAYALGRVWPALRLPLWALASLIALSRWYLGVHDPIDIAGGALLGLAVGWFVVGRTRWTLAPSLRTGQ